MDKDLGLKKKPRRKWKRFLRLLVQVIRLLRELWALLEDVLDGLRAS